MLRRLLDEFVYIGPAVACAGYVYFSVSGRWDWKAQALVYGGCALFLVYVAVNFQKIRAGLKSRSVRHGAASGLAVLLAFGILALANFLNFRHHKRIDLTENQLFALSTQSRKVVENLKSEVRVIGFFQDEPGARKFEDLVKEYQYQASKLKFEVVDPQKDPGKVDQYDVRRNGQVVVTHGTKAEIIEDATEEKITNAIIKVTREGEKVVYFLQGHGERDIQDTNAQGFSVMREGIENQNYRVKTYNLAQENRLPEDVAVMVSAGPQVSFLPTEVELLKDFLASGGAFLLLVDPKTDFAMNDFLGAYGLGLEENLVIDTSGIGQLFGLGPAAPLVAEYANHALTKELQGIMTFFPLSQSVTTSPSSLGYETEKLLSTSPHSWGETNLGTKEASFEEGKDLQGPLHLAAVATYSADPKSDGDSQEPAEENQKSTEQGQTSEGAEQQEETRFVLFGDSDFATNAYFSSAGNGDLFLMAISWLAADTDLVAIRPREPENRSVNLSLSQNRVAFWSSVVLLPLVTLILGINVWYRRR